MQDQPIYQHEAGSGPDRYLLDQVQAAHDGWNAASGPLFRAFYGPTTGTIPIYSHEAGAPDRYYYNTSPNGNSGWGAGTVAFYAYDPAKPQPDGTVTVYQHKATHPDRFFISLGKDDGVKYGWSQGSLLCYAWPNQAIYQHEAGSGPDRYLLDRL